MAAPIRFQELSYDPREELRARLEAAPVEHSEALLAWIMVASSLLPLLVGGRRRTTSEPARAN